MLSKQLKQYCHWLGLAGSCVLLGACAVAPSLPDAPLLRAQQARLITDNDDAFQTRLSLVNKARSRIDAMYYIYSEDHSSALFSEALIAAAQRGVQVRLLVDYQSAYKDLDMFRMLERYGKRGAGRLEVRFFGRPSRNIMMDAAYLSLSCEQAIQAYPEADCASAKQAYIEQRFEAEAPALAELNISNLELAGSGLLLSALYAKNLELLAWSVLRATTTDDSEAAAGFDVAAIGSEDITNFAKLARLFWRARTGAGVQSLAAQLQLGLAWALYGEQLDPLYATLSRYLPIARRDFAASARDWDYLTTYLHHKLLLVDQQGLMLGGRNIEDSYHMNPHPLAPEALFIDTDVYVELASGGEYIEATFERLWNARTLVARLDEVYAHAPNDIVANKPALQAAQSVCQHASDRCIEREVKRRARSRDQRISARYQTMRRLATEYRQHYQSQPITEPDLSIDPGASLYYLENLPVRDGKRIYGAPDNDPAGHGKAIQAAVLDGLAAVCRATGGTQRVILHNAYVLPPGNLMRALGRMLDGELNCSGVRIDIVTNSTATTDLPIINLLGDYAIKALFEYLAQQRDPQRGAQLHYFEYQPAQEGKQLLHSKVWLLGDKLIIGSANADVRSYMLDSNNALSIHQAPRLNTAYRARIDTLLASEQVRERGRWYQNIEVDDLLQRDTERLRALLGTLGAAEKLSSEQRQVLENGAVGLLRLLYTLNQASLRAEGADARDRLNRLFKLF